MINITYLFAKHNVSPEDEPIITEMIALMIAVNMSIPEGNDRLTIMAMEIAADGLRMMKEAEVGIKQKDSASIKRMLMMPMAKGTH